MPRPGRIIPAHRKHKQTGRAAVSIYRQDGSRTGVILPGEYGSKESKHEYELPLTKLPAGDGNRRPSEMQEGSTPDRFGPVYHEQEYQPDRQSESGRPGAAPSPPVTLVGVRLLYLS